MSYNTRKKFSKELAIRMATACSADDSASDYSNSGSEYEASDMNISESSNEDLSEHASDSESNSSFETDERISNKCSEGEVLKNKNSGRDKMYVIKSDDYFTNSSQKKAIISNNALDKLETPRLQQDQLQKLLSNNEAMKKHKKNLKDLVGVNREQFARWLYLMEEGFNIILYGLGSKIKILQEFQTKYLTDSPVVVVNGFFPSLSIKNIIENIMSDVLELNENPANIFDACDLIAQELLCVPSMHLYVIVHNIEGDMLKNSKAQNVLSRLATVRNIHLIASIDHVSAPLIWDNFKLSKFNFIWYDVTSFLPYLSETSFEGSMIVQRSKTLALSSLNNVFLSLTSNSKGIYLVIVKYQLENGRGQHYQGFLFKDLYWACREAFLVSSDLALRSQLTEFVDHKMLKYRRSADGSEYLVIPTAANILQQFFNEQSK